MKDPSLVQPICSYEAFEPYRPCKKHTFTRCDECGKPYCADHVRLSASGRYRCPTCLGEPVSSWRQTPPPPRRMIQRSQRFLAVGALTALLGLMVYFGGSSGKGGFPHAGQGDPFLLVLSALGGLAMLVGLALLLVGNLRGKEE